MVENFKELFLIGCSNSILGVNLFLQKSWYIMVFDYTDVNVWAKALQLQSKNTDLSSEWSK